MADALREGETDAPAIQTVQRLAAVLNIFTVDRPRLTFAEIVAELALSKATAHRYARALREARLLRYDTGSDTYAIGPLVLALEAAARAGLPIVTAAEPFLERLLAETDRTVVLSVWNGETATVVRCLDNTTGEIRLRVRVGAQLHPTRSAQGRIFCAFLPPSEAPAVARQMRASSELRQIVEEIRRTGMAVNTQVDYGVRVLAAPVFEQTRVVAAMALMGTSVTLSGEDEASAAAALRRVSGELSSQLAAV
ncbi:IclR family transcriptional regulator [Dactylosporangium sp. CA-233914]|uniref:IclR family transcriptional regulator n=1 Tax=Dactylosporangium sp. CA-233914 TaxID=3239934 RepID=UPI003D93881D